MGTKWDEKLCKVSNRYSRLKHVQYHETQHNCVAFVYKFIRGILLEFLIYSNESWIKGVKYD